MKILKNIIILVVIAGALIAAYLLFFRQEEEPTGLSSNSLAPTAAAPSDTQIGREFLSMLLNINSITLNDSVLASPAFTSLKDFTIELNQEGPAGRPNPFAPIGIDAVDEEEQAATAEEAPVPSAEE